MAEYVKEIFSISINGVDNYIRVYARDARNNKAQVYINSMDIVATLGSLAKGSGSLFMEKAIWQDFSSSDQAGGCR